MYNLFKSNFLYDSPSMQDGMLVVEVATNGKHKQANEADFSLCSLNVTVQSLTSVLVNPLQCKLHAVPLCMENLDLTGNSKERDSIT